MRQIDWTGPARDDLRAIFTWLIHEAEPETALQQVRAIRHRATFLVDFPRGGPGLSGEVRVLRVLGTPYRLHYRLIGADQIQILRVHHVRQQWDGE
jgi:plasmid stabilization system protein ParE